MVLSDLPAGIYKISLRYDDKIHQFWVEIFPGQVTYFTFRADKGFELLPIPTPKLKFIPPTPTIPTTPEAKERRGNDDGSSGEKTIGRPPPETGPGENPGSSPHKAAQMIIPLLNFKIFPEIIAEPIVDGILNKLKSTF